MNKKLRIRRAKVVSSKEVVYDANDVLKSDPLNGVGVPSSYPAFEEMMNSYHGGKVIKLMPYDDKLKYLADQVSEDDPPDPAYKWKDTL
jgi:hypothetical protein